MTAWLWAWIAWTASSLRVGVDVPGKWCRTWGLGEMCYFTVPWASEWIKPLDVCTHWHLSAQHTACLGFAVKMAAYFGKGRGGPGLKRRTSTKWHLYLFSRSSLDTCLGVTQAVTYFLYLLYSFSRWPAFSFSALPSSGSTICCLPLHFPTQPPHPDLLLYHTGSNLPSLFCRWLLRSFWHFKVTAVTTGTETKATPKSRAPMVREKKADGAAFCMFFSTIY